MYTFSTRFCRRTFACWRGRLWSPTLTPGACVPPPPLQRRLSPLAAALTSLRPAPRPALTAFRERTSITFTRRTWTWRWEAARGLRPCNDARCRSCPTNVRLLPSLSLSQRMQRAADFYVGTHDFRNFCKVRHRGTAGGRGVGCLTARLLRRAHRYAALQPDSAGNVTNF